MIFAGSSYLKASSCEIILEAVDSVALQAFRKSWLRVSSSRSSAPVWGPFKVSAPTHTAQPLVVSSWSTQATILFSELRLREEQVDVIDPEEETGPGAELEGSAAGCKRKEIDCSTMRPAWPLLSNCVLLSE